MVILPFLFLTYTKCITDSDAVINYRHIIAGLVRKPGAFTNYDLSTLFRTVCLGTFLHFFVFHW